MVADLVSVTTALASLKTAIEIARLLKESGSTLEAAERKMHVAGLIDALAEARIEVAGIKEVLLEKDELIAQLKQEFALAGNLVWEQPYYFVVDDNKKDGPFCQQCYDSEHKLIRLQGRQRSGGWDCHNCGGFFKDSSYRPPSSGIVRG